MSVSVFPTCSVASLDAPEGCSDRGGDGDDNGRSGEGWIGGG